jgi:hypothetical protein
MELVAHHLAFRCPFTRKEVRFSLDEQDAKVIF